MKAVILAGGLGSRIAEETIVRPKPMVEIGGLPILWHIMKIYGAAGVSDFVVCLGYKGDVIKRFFAEYFLRTSDVTFDLAANRMDVHESRAESWRVTLADTGADTMTGGRLLRVRRYLGDERFCLAYGDGLADIDIKALVEAHASSGRLATVTAVQPPGRYGSLKIADRAVTQFEEKPRGDGEWVNGGFFVCEPQIFSFIEGDATVLEEEPMRRLARSGQLNAFQHSGFWHSLSTVNDRNHLERLWQGGNAPWKVW
jgi:glucose-1-phosphate cytidylyltransferase